MAKVYVVLTAAGSGTRLGARVPKALVTLQGIPLLTWALQGLQQSEAVDAVCVTAPSEYVAEFSDLATDRSFPVSVTAGGASRQASVLAGLETLEAQYDPDDDAIILVHDAARCLTPPELIRFLVEAVDADRPAVIPGLPVTDTIKEIGSTRGRADMSVIVGTPNRANLRQIQTPQAFRWNVLWEAHQAAKNLGQNEENSATDDSILVEELGIPVLVCPGSPLAMKITTEEDLETAERIIRRGKA